jgi:hypothetical protein
MPADVDNPRGFWERRDVYELHEWVLGEAGAAWDRPLDFDPDRLPLTTIPLSLSGEATAVLNRYVEAQRSPGGVVDSRDFASA